MLFRSAITPRRVADLLILNADMPRSLRASINEVNRLLHEINGPKARPLLRHCGLLYAELRDGRIDDIIGQGLHEYLTDTLTHIREIGELINHTYFWPTDA